MSRFTYGKYMNRTFEYVVKEDPAYIVWFYEKPNNPAQIPRSIYIEALEATRAAEVERSESNALDRTQRVMTEPEPSRTYYADGSCDVNFGGPCGPLHLDRDGNM